MLSYLQAVILGLLQGVTELFPVSSLGHSVIFPALFGWHSLVAAQSAKESFFLAFLVGLHVATALALMIFFRTDWLRIIKGFLRSLRRRRIESVDERLAWLLLLATIPAGITGLLFEHLLRTVFAKPLYASVLLTINGVILLAGERVRRGATIRALAVAAVSAEDSVPADDRGARREHLARSERTHSRALARLAFREAGIIGLAQVFALLAGISRSGITMVAGLARGLSHEDAARFSFLLATPIILAAGVYKLPDLLGPNGSGVRGQILVGSLAAGLAAYLSVRFLTRYFRTRTLLPFAIYCLLAGIAFTVRFA
jgi:undecaprenyl-diphosphatase